MDATKIQLSPTKVIPSLLTVWHEQLPGVDISMDLKNLTFAPGSIDAIYSFHVLDHLFDADIKKALSNWHSLLKVGGEIFIVVDDFEYIARSLVGGDINIDHYNQEFSHPTQFARDNLVKYMNDAGFMGSEIVVWYTDVTNLFPKKPFELVLSCKKV